MKKHRMIVAVTEGRWPGVLVVVTEKTSWGVKGYMPIPEADNVVSRAHVRLELGKFAIVGDTWIEDDEPIRPTPP